MSKKDNVVPIGAAAGKSKTHEERVDNVEEMLKKMDHVRGKIEISAEGKKSLTGILTMLIDSHDNLVAEGKELPYGHERMYNDSKELITAIETVGLDNDEPLDVPVAQLALIDTIGVMMGQPSQVVPGLEQALPKKDQVFTMPDGNDIIH